jgi:hypothetical protein
MKQARKGQFVSPSVQKRLSELEGEVSKRGVHIHYDRLEAAGLKLRGGVCKVRGEYHLYLDRRKQASEKIDILLESLDQLNNQASIPDAEYGYQPESEKSTEAL